ncbi:maleylpyruvate isomerase N-terminal domain-containing protein [Nocardioides pantholopis]|uniref:maleylpyruvate isomerase N-terminal domain-containing protein n=1 Tax=Nocardioides pantholopis TaxID=2483798 RepID=UPI000F099A12|nr:maleylpyruvate isomerase N-terminal domain-containing protein [Nocardioides pantholopis]
MGTKETSLGASTLLEYPAYLDHIRRDSRRFREVLTDCDPATPVPGCPDWTAADLLWHLTEVQSFWAQTVRSRPAAPPQEGPGPARPTAYADLLATFDERSAALVDELAAADPRDPAWHWAPEQTVGTSYRRQAHEALIHRLDAEQTAGAVTPLDPVLAADGVHEALDVMYGGKPPAWGRFEPGPHHVRLDLVDQGTSIWARPGSFHGTDPESGRRYDDPHLQVVPAPDAPPAAVISGRAADVDAWLWHRLGEHVVGPVLKVTGDRAAYDALLTAVSESVD